MRVTTPHATLTTLALLLVAIGSFGYWTLQGRAHTYPDAPAGKFACLSYTPRSNNSQGTPSNSRE
jgi:hypothetical protein